MIIHRWLQGLLARRPARLLGSVLGVATTITLLSSLGIFLSTSSQTMTARAVSTVPIDWQVQLARGADEGVVMEALSRTSSFELMERVGYAKVAGFRAATGGTVQTTGPGFALGISPRYRSSFPQVIRQLTGWTKWGLGSPANRRKPAHQTRRLPDNRKNGRITRFCEC